MSNKPSKSKWPIAVATLVVVLAAFFLFRGRQGNDAFDEGSTSGNSPSTEADGRRPKADGERYDRAKDPGAQAMAADGKDRYEVQKVVAKQLPRDTVEKLFNRLGEAVGKHGAGSPQAKAIAAEILARSDVKAAQKSMEDYSKRAVARSETATNSSAARKAAAQTAELISKMKPGPETVEKMKQQSNLLRKKTKAPTGKPDGK